MELMLYAIAVAAQTSEPDAERRALVYVLWARTPEAAQADVARQVEREYAQQSEKWWFEYAVSAPIAYQAITVAVPIPLDKQA